PITSPSASQNRINSSFSATPTPQPSTPPQSKNSSLSAAKKSKSLSLPSPRPPVFSTKAPGWPNATPSSRNYSTSIPKPFWKSPARSFPQARKPPPSIPSKPSTNSNPCANKPDKSGTRLIASSSPQPAPSTKR